MSAFPRIPARCIAQESWVMEFNAFGVDSTPDFSREFMTELKALLSVF